MIGATMGADARLSDEDVAHYIDISTRLYPKHWRFEPEHIASYRLGVGFGQDNLPGRNLHLIPSESAAMRNRTVASVRCELGLVKEEMRAYYRAEEILTSGTRATRRLDTCAKRPDGDML